ncbi:MAG: SdrD B-like domain-containing protein, partial [Bacteroidia bacterium]
VTVDNSTPNVSIANATLPCGGGSVTLTATGSTATYSWTGPNGFTATGATVSVTTAGTYTNVATGTNGCTTTTTVTVSAATNCGSIGDFVWEDTNGNGKQGGNEPGISGVTVTLYTCAGAQVATTTTNASGNYSFNNLAAGSYYVIVSGLPAGYAFTTQNTGGDTAKDSDVNASGQTACFTLNAGQDKDDVDAGATPQGSTIGDFVWYDQDNDGIQDAGEPGLPNVSVALYDCNANLIGTTTTNANGQYAFTNVLPGSYYVIFSNQPAGYTFTGKDQGSDDAKDSDADLSGQTACFTITSGQTKDDIDAGLIGPGSIGNYVWEDLDNDGIQDPNESGLGGVVVSLYDCSNNLIATTTTNNQGAYDFQNIAPGQYYVSFTLPSRAYSFATMNAGTDPAKDSDPNASGRTICFTLNPGEDKDDIDAGVLTPGSIGDYVWEDLNNDGLQDQNEPGVSGITVDLFVCGSTSPIATTTTSSSGAYSFQNIIPGSYTVTFSNLPAGFIFALPNQGSNDALDSDPGQNGSTGCFTLGVGETLNDIDAGIVGSRVCLAVAGTVTPSDTLFDLAGSSVTITATDDGNSTIPAGYSVSYLLANQAGRVLQVSSTPNFVVSDQGDYCIHVLIYSGNTSNPNYFDLNQIVPGTTYLWQITNLLVQRGICGELNPGCTKVRVRCIALGDCVATAFNPQQWSVIFTNGTKPNAAPPWYHWANNSGRVETFADGTAHITGTLVHTNDPNFGFVVDVWLENRRDWGQWSALGRGKKSDPFSNLYQTWDYYELDDSRSKLIGNGVLTGDTLFLTHKPASYYFGFQIGTGANDKTLNDFGLSGWFSYTSASGLYTGGGDFNMNLSCGQVCPDPLAASPMIATQVILQGPYSGSGDTMATALNQQGVLPLHQPYNVHPWNYQGTESVTAIPNDSIVDWVLVEMRHPLNQGLVLSRMAAFVNEDGEVVGLNGTTLLDASNLPAGTDSFNLVIQHRNHVRAMTATPMKRYGNVFFADFTKSLNDIYTDPTIPNAAAHAMSNGTTVLFEGDASGDAQINSVDLGAIMFRYFHIGFGKADVNLDGVTNSLDVGRTLDNYFKQTHVPR